MTKTKPEVTDLILQIFRIRFLTERRAKKYKPMTCAEKVNVDLALPPGPAQTQVRSNLVSQ